MAIHLVYNTIIEKKVILRNVDINLAKMMNFFLWGYAKKSGLEKQSTINFLAK